MRKRSYVCFQWMFSRCLSSSIMRVNKQEHGVKFIVKKPRSSLFQLHELGNWMKECKCTFYVCCIHSLASKVWAVCTYKQFTYTGMESCKVLTSRKQLKDMERSLCMNGAVVMISLPLMARAWKCVLNEQLPILENMYAY